MSSLMGVQMLWEVREGVISYFESGQASQGRQLAGQNLNDVFITNDRQDFNFSVTENAGS